MNKNLKIVIASPMTTKIRNYPSRAGIVFEGEKGEVALDQLLSVDKSRLIKKLGKVDSENSVKILGVLREMFA